MATHAPLAAQEQTVSAQRGGADVGPTENLDGSGEQITLEYDTVVIAFEALREKIVGAPLEDGNPTARFAAELRALVRLAAALRLPEQDRRQPDRRGLGRPWSAPR